MAERNIIDDHRATLVRLDCDRIRVAAPAGRDPPAADEDTATEAGQVNAES